MRTIRERIVVEGWLVAQGPLHVGGLGVDPDVDLTLATDGLGRHVVLGTSLAGALRSWMEVATEQVGRAPGLLDRLWGEHRPKGDVGDASLVVVEDALVFPSREAGQAEVGRNGLLKNRLHMPDTAGHVSIRAGVGIDHATGAASETILYTRAVLAPGVALRFRLMAEARDDDDAEQFRAHVAALCDALGKGAIRLGAARSRGCGRVRLDTVGATVTRQKMYLPETILATLGVADDPVGIPLAEFDWDTTSVAQVTWRLPVRITIPWRPVAAIMVKDAVEGLAIDALPLTMAGPDGMRRPVIPGSSIKGALRSRAEYILRGLVGPRVALPTGSDDPRGRFLEQRDALPLATALFGRAGKSAGKPDGRERRGLGALWTADVVGEAQLSEEEWRQLVFGAPRQGAMERADISPDLACQITSRGLRPRTHVAIDRWTGGAAKGLLYSVMEPTDVAWDAIELEVHRHRLSEAEYLPALVLLLLVVRDFAQGLVPLGFATRRGMGSAEADESEITIEGLEPIDGKVSLKDLRDGRLKPEWTNKANQAWEEWLEAHGFVEMSA